MDEILYNNLNHPKVEERLKAITLLKENLKKGLISEPVFAEDVNNHIHTTYSFSPYSPSKAVWCGYNAGLRTVGIMDHDSIAGANEFIKASKIMKIASTIGVECRANMNKTPLNGRKINNPDQASVAYVALHGIPHTKIGRVSDFFKPYREARNIRNRAMIININKILSSLSLYIDFEKDVLPLSMTTDGGSVTERHLLYALTIKIINKFGKGEKTVDFLINSLKLNISDKVKNFLMDTSNIFYEYDLLGVLKSDLVSKFYIDATDECPEIFDVVSLSKEVGAVMAYPYLGDITESVTGDKKAQKFEDSFLDELFEVIYDLGFNAVTYMPSRNTFEQLINLRAHCDKFELFQISGEDINTPRQSFICMAQRNPEFKNLFDAAWALIGHEYISTEKGLDFGFFSEKTKIMYPDLYDRIAYFKKIGMESI